MTYISMTVEDVEWCRLVYFCSAV